MFLLSLKRTLILGFWLCFSAGLLTACDNQGAVVFAPNSDDSLQLATYTHPSGVFSLDVPPDWVTYPQTTDNLAAVTFSSPGMPTPHMIIAVIQLDETDRATDFTALLDAYQQGVRVDATSYVEQNRQALPDGSWAITGLRTSPGGTPQTVNSFVVRDEAIFSVIEVVLPLDAATAALTELAANTFRINQGAAELTPTSLLTLSTINTAPIEVINIATWATENGVFFITGEVANHTRETIAPVPIRLRLQDDNGAVIGEAFDASMGHGIAAQGFAPFSLRFGEGRPPDLAAFSVMLGDDAWQATFADAEFIQGGDSLTGVSNTSLSASGQLTVEGTISNNGTQAISEVLVVITVFDDQQRVIAGRFFPVSETPLAPGDTIDYAVLIPELGGNPSDFIVELQGVVDG